jgi:hypothetical protein
VGIFLCPAAVVKSRGKAASDRTFQNGRGIAASNQGVSCLLRKMKGVMFSMQNSPLTRRRIRGLSRFPSVALACSVLAAVFAMGAGAADSQPSGTAAKTVTLTIDYGDGVEKRFKAIPWREGMTALDTMQFAGKHPRGIEYKMRGKGKTAFLTRIDDLANRGSRDGNWIYRVNGKQGQSSFALYRLKPQDAVLWTFGTYP